MIHTEATQGHNSGIIAPTTGEVHAAQTQPIAVSAFDLTITHHIDLITDHQHIEVLRLPIQRSQ